MSTILKISINLIKLLDTEYLIKFIRYSNKTAKQKH